MFVFLNLFSLQEKRKVSDFRTFNHLLTESENMTILTLIFFYIYFFSCQSSNNSWELKYKRSDKDGGFKAALRNTWQQEDTNILNSKFTQITKSHFWTYPCFILLIYF